MGLYIKILLFAFLKFSGIHGENFCPASYCGSSMLSVRFPFKLGSQTPKNNCTYFDLQCNITQSTTILNLPHAGDFYVESIDYAGGSIQLYDPGNCLVRRLMNFSLESSPFKASYENYTFYVCPSYSPALYYGVSQIGCLSNSTNVTIATRDLPREIMDSAECRGIGSWLLPVQAYGIYDNLLLFLTWNASICINCEESDDHESGKGGVKPIAKIVALALSMPGLLIMALSCCSVFCLHVMKMICNKYEADSAAAAPTTAVTPQTIIATALPLPSTTNNRGLDESKITACTEIIVLTGSDEGILSAKSNMCSICLENFCQKETISLISKCGHCFHANCVQQWLAKNGTCPVCRTSLSDVAL